MEQLWRRSEKEARSVPACRPSLCMHVAGRYVRGRRACGGGGAFVQDLATARGEGNDGGRHGHATEELLAGSPVRPHGYASHGRGKSTGRFIIPQSKCARKCKAYFNHLIFTGKLPVYSATAMAVQVTSEVKNYIQILTPPSDDYKYRSEPKAHQNNTAAGEEKYRSEGTNL